MTFRLIAHKLTQPALNIRKSPYQNERSQRYIWPVIQIQNLSKGYGAQELFRNVTLQVNPGERLGITGRNGTGKSTLFKILIGEDSADSGMVNVPRNYTIGHLRQHISFTHASVLAEATASLKPHEDGFTEEHRAEAILFGLGFGKEDLERDPMQLSGGFQIRLNLAKVLLSEPNMLLLDEPTNYLDIISVRWIERFLRGWPGELLLITHDRGFMNRVCTHVAGIHRQQVRKIPGTVEKLMETILADEEVALRTQENEAKKREQLEKFISRFRAQATKAAAVQSRVKALERKGQPAPQLGAIKDLDFAFTGAPFPGKRMLQATELSFRWSEQGPWLFRELGFEVFTKDRIAVIGPNGRGKTTLLNVLAKELSASTGQVSYNPNLQLGYFGQTNILRLDPGKTVEEEIQASVKDAARGRARSLAGLMMFEGDAALKRVKVLSGGERSRVLLAKILAQPCNLLLLDEPTNHLDMESVDSLAEAIGDFEGAVVMVTHDENLLHTLATRLVVFDGDQTFLFEGTYADFLERVGWVEEKADAPSTHQAGVATPVTPLATTSNDRSKEARRARAEYVAERAKYVRPVEQKISQCERDIERDEARVPELEHLLAQASEACDVSRITALAKELDEVRSRLDLTLCQWDEAQQALADLREKYPLEER